MDPEELSTLVRSGRKRRLFEPTAVPTVNIGRRDIERLVPHREPFLMLDRIIAVDLPNLVAAGARHVAPDDPVFRGHFPEQPVYPGVLQVEMVGQLGLCLLGLLETSGLSFASAKRPRQIRMLKIHHAVFLAEIRPHDDLLLLVKIIHFDDFTGICAGQIVKEEDVICAFVVMEVYFAAA
jgi:3-hydroxyacyl-[acyl-carrier-protein] dehydratase